MILICIRTGDIILKNIYVYTPYHAVSADTIRRYHTGLVRQTNQKASQIVEKYCRTVYKSIG